MENVCMNDKDFIIYTIGANISPLSIRVRPQNSRMISGNNLEKLSTLSTVTLLGRGRVQGLCPNGALTSNH